MSRRHSAEKREINPDAKFGNLVISKFMNTIMIQGKKSVAEAIVYGALEAIDGKTMQEKFANELLDAANLRGGAVKKREDTHRMAEANKAFAHYRW